MSCIITEWYCDVSGDLFAPDTYIGSDLDLRINWNTFLTNENDTFTSMTWDAFPVGLTKSYQSDAAGISILQIEATAAGTYLISGVMECIESGHTQKLPFRFYLKVESRV